MVAPIVALAIVGVVLLDGRMFDALLEVAVWRVRAKTVAEFRAAKAVEPARVAAPPAPTRSALTTCAIEVKADPSGRVAVAFTALDAAVETALDTDSARHFARALVHAAQRADAMRLHLN